MKPFITTLFKRDKNSWRQHWRLLAAIIGIAIFEFLIDYNLAIHNSLAKLKLAPDLIQWIHILVGAEWDWNDVIWVGCMAVILLAGFTRLLRVMVMWYALNGVVTILASVVALVITVAFRDDDVWGLLWDAALVWMGNVVVFASWYWLIDAPNSQTSTPKNGETKRWEFLFPQRSSDIPGWGDWTPRFFDYIFLAFTTATAFSPTETAPLSRRAKVLTMLQSLISLVVIAVLAARGINILKPPV